MIEFLRSDLEAELKAKLRLDCRLILFGSAGNGFGLASSDADMCLRLYGDAEPEVTLVLPIFIKSFCQFVLSKYSFFSRTSQLMLFAKSQKSLST